MTIKVYDKRSIVPCREYADRLGLMAAFLEEQLEDCSFRMDDIHNRATIAIDALALRSAQILMYERMVDNDRCEERS